MCRIYTDVEWHCAPDCPVGRRDPPNMTFIEFCKPDDPDNFQPCPGPIKVVDVPIIVGVDCTHCHEQRRKSHVMNLRHWWRAKIKALRASNEPLWQIQWYRGTQLYFAERAFNKYWKDLADFSPDGKAWSNQNVYQFAHTERLSICYKYWTLKIPFIPRLYTPEETSKMRDELRGALAAAGHSAEKPPNMVWQKDMGPYEKHNEKIVRTYPGVDRRALHWAESRKNEATNGHWNWTPSTGSAGSTKTQMDDAFSTCTWPAYTPLERHTIGFPNVPKKPWWEPHPDYSDCPPHLMKEYIMDKFEGHRRLYLEGEMPPINRMFPTYKKAPPSTSKTPSANRTPSVDNKSSSSVKKMPSTDVKTPSSDKKRSPSVKKMPSVDNKTSPTDRKMPSTDEKMPLSDQKMSRDGKVPSPARSITNGIFTASVLQNNVATASAHQGTKSTSSITPATPVPKTALKLARISGTNKDAKQAGSFAPVDAAEHKKGRELTTASWMPSREIVEDWYEVDSEKETMQDEWYHLPMVRIPLVQYPNWRKPVIPRIQNEKGQAVVDFGELFKPPRTAAQRLKEAGHERKVLYPARDSMKAREESEVPPREDLKTFRAKEAESALKARRAQDLKAYVQSRSGKPLQTQKLMSMKQTAETKPAPPSPAKTSSPPPAKTASPSPAKTSQEKSSTKNPAEELTARGFDVDDIQAVKNSMERAGRAALGVYSEEDLKVFNRRHQALFQRQSLKQTAGIGTALAQTEARKIVKQTASSQIAQKAPVTSSSTYISSSTRADRGTPSAISLNQKIRNAFMGGKTAAQIRHTVLVPSSGRKALTIPSSTRTLSSVQTTQAAPKSKIPAPKEDTEAVLKKVAAELAPSFQITPFVATPRPSHVPNERVKAPPKVAETSVSVSDPFSPPWKLNLASFNMDIRVFKALTDGGKHRENNINGRTSQLVAAKTVADQEALSGNLKTAQMSCEKLGNQLMLKNSEALAVVQRENSSNGHIQQPVAKKTVPDETAGKTPGQIGYEKLEREFMLKGRGPLGVTRRDNNPSRLVGTKTAPGKDIVNTTTAYNVDGDDMIKVVVSTCNTDRLEVDNKPMTVREIETLWYGKQAEQQKLQEELKMGILPRCDADEGKLPARDTDEEFHPPRGFVCGMEGVRSVDNGNGGSTDGGGSDELEAGRDDSSDGLEACSNEVGSSGSDEASCEAWSTSEEGKGTPPVGSDGSDGDDEKMREEDDGKGEEVREEASGDPGRKAREAMRHKCMMEAMKLAQMGFLGDPNDEEEKLARLRSIAEQLWVWAMH